MRFIKKTILITSLMILMVIPIFAQLPDPYDPDFSPKYDVIDAKTAKGRRVRSLNIYKNGKIYNTIIFNNLGEKIRYGDENYFAIYNEKGWIKEAHFFIGNSYTGKLTYTLTPYGDLKEISEEYATYLGNDQKKSIYTYANGLLSNITVNLVSNMTYYIKYSDSYYDYIYDSSRNLEKRTAQKTWRHYGMYIPSGSSLDSLVYNNGHLLFYTEDSSKYKCYYDKNDRIDHINLINDDPNALIQYLTVITFEYYDNGLVKSRKEFDGQTWIIWTYEYEFMDPTTLMIEIPDQYQEISFWNYGQSSDLQTHKIGNGHVVAKVYVPDLELYVLKLTSQLTIPLIVQPGAKTFLTATANGIYYAKEDTMNTFALNLEKTKNEAYTLYGADNAPAALANHIVIELQKHPDNPAFLFYTDYWDLGNHKQLFLDYTKKLIDLYPNNFKVKEVYSLLRKNN